MLDPRRGEILALAQNPSFDPNLRTGIAPELLRNRAVTDAYEPGSTMKALLAAAALDHRVVSPPTASSARKATIGFAGHTIHDHHGYGWLSLPEILQVSSNVGATKIGERLGAKTYYQTLRAFGIGRANGRRSRRGAGGHPAPASAWKPIDLATASFGQGVAVTPLQLAVAYAALANGGILMRPYIVKRIVDDNGEVALENQPTVVRRVVSEATARQSDADSRGSRRGQGHGAACCGARAQDRRQDRHGAEGRLRSTAGTRAGASLRSWGTSRRMIRSSSCW